MNDKTAIRLALIMTGKYDLPAPEHAGYIIKGTDAFGNDVSEQIRAVDEVALDRDVQLVIDGKMPAPGSR